MKLIRQVEDWPQELRGGALAVGNFDGVHRGHARIIERLRQAAQRCGGPAVVFTFEPHPARLLRPDDPPPPLTWIERKAELLAACGADAVWAYPTDRPLLDLSYDQFFQTIVVQRVAARALVEGANFAFGRDRQGGLPELRTLSERHGIELTIVEPLRTSDAVVSSSRLRQLIAAGAVAEAAALLTQPYRLRGRVTRGASRGSQIGFRTANLDAVDTLVPAPGVYAGRAYLGGQTRWAAIHLGPNPTFGDRASKVEVHLLDYSQSLYGQSLEVDFIQRLRDIRQFGSAESLRLQIADDVRAIRTLAGDPLAAAVPPTHAPRAPLR